MTRIHFAPIDNIEGEACWVMWADVETDTGMVELLVDEKVPDVIPDDYESDVYLRLLAEIHEQAEDEGIDPDELIEYADWCDMVGEEDF